MSLRPRWLVSMFFVSNVLAACAEGAPSMPPDQPVARPAAPITVCGNGMREGIEQCDCPPTASMMCAAPSGVTCESLSMGTGTVYCKPFECTFITTFCTMGTMMPGGAGMGGGAGRGG
jgi:hypothetical protein